MVNQKLLNYVKEQLKKGQTAAAVRSALLRYGYSPGDVDEAIRAAQRGPLLFAGAIAVAVTIVVVVGLFFIFKGGDKPGSLGLEVDVQAQVNEVKAGGLLGFTLSVVSSGNGGEEKVGEGKVRYSVLDAEGKDIVSKEEAISIDKGATLRDSIALPHSMNFGSYSLVAEVTVGGASFRDSAQFEVSEKESSVRVVEESVSAVHQDEQKVIEDIVKLAGEDPERAKNLCLEFANSEIGDQCLLEAGLSVNNDLFCPSIKNDDKRDTCYFNLVLILRKSMLCESITNENLRSTCMKI